MSMNGDLTPFVGLLPRCYRDRVSAVSLCSVSYKISGAEPNALDDLSTIESILHDAAQTAGLTAVSSAHHQFEPQGLSAVIILSESHIAAHTWPEFGNGYVTLTSCRTLAPAQIEAVGEMVRRRLRAQQVTSSGITL
jgi:S-adenosylmethionine decarboxylase proenzyme